MLVEMNPAALAARLNRHWRQLAAGFSFIVFGVGAMLVGSIIIPVARLFTRGSVRREQVSRAIIRGGMRLFWRAMLILRLFRCDLRGIEHLTGERLLIVANHPTLIDAVLLLGLVKDAVVVAKPSLAANPVTGPAVAAAGYIVNAEGPALVAAAAQVFPRAPERRRASPFGCSAVPPISRFVRVVALSRLQSVCRIRCSSKALPGTRCRSICRGSTWRSVSRSKWGRSSRHTIHWRSPRAS
jgi:hypothetical protein